MSSMKSGTAQPDVGQQPAFRVKLRVTQVAYTAYGMLGCPVRPVKAPVAVARVWARMGDSFAAKALRRVGLEP